MCVDTREQTNGSLYNNLGKKEKEKKLNIIGKARGVFLCTSCHHICTTADIQEQRRRKGEDRPLISW